MGMREDIRWIQDNKERAGVFVTIAKRGPCKMRELKGYLRSEDWWPAKSYVADLVERGVVIEAESRFRLTESGEKAFGSLKTVYDIEGV